MAPGQFLDEQQWCGLDFKSKNANRSHSFTIRGCAASSRCSLCCKVCARLVVAPPSLVLG